MNDLKTKSLEFHVGGKVEIKSKVKLDDKNDLSLAYSPGVAYPCLEIAEDKELAYRYTSKYNTIAVITDGSAVLGLGDIGPVAAMPVMEGKCLLFKKFANVDAIPICIDAKDTEELINTIKAIAPSFGGINLEDIAFPKCVEVEERLAEELDIPVFHDDQKGTAIVTAAALINAARLVNKPLHTLRVAMSGFGSAGSSIAKLLKKLGVKTIYAVNRKGIISKTKDYPKTVTDMLENNLIDSYDIKDRDDLAEIVKDSDVFIGVSVQDVLTPEMVNTMKDKPIIFALANPNPEISYENAQKSKAYIIATGRSDYPNQINNVLAFPGLFRGILDARYKKITDEMCLAASYAIADLIKDEIRPDYIVPSVFDERVVVAVRNAIIETGE